jgi:hypothetical protein
MRKALGEHQHLRERCDPSPESEYERILGEYAQSRVTYTVIHSMAMLIGKPAAAIRAHPECPGAINHARCLNTTTPTA